MAKQIFGKIVAVVILTLLFGTTFAVTIQSKTDYENNQTKQTSKISDKKPEGLAPPNTKPEPNLTVKQHRETPHLFDSTNVFLDQENIAYAYVAYDPSGQIPEGFVYFYLDDPSQLYPIGGSIPWFASGADFLNETIMYICLYDGGLYRMNIETIEIIFIGSMIPLGGLTFDLTTNTWYGSGSNNLYTIDITTGASTFIGPHGTPNTIVGLACDTNGTIYGYDVLFSGNSTLYSINKSTGAATVIGSMGIGFCYAQDLAYDRNNGILYISGYTQQGTSGLYICDTTTAETTLVGSFPGGAEIDGLAIPWCLYDFDHDIAISDIVKPANQNAAPITPIVKVKNVGLNTEYDVDVQLEIAKEVLGETWTQEQSTEWKQSNTANAGGTAPEAYLPYSDITGDYAWFMSPTVDTSGLSSLTLYFRSMINNYAGGYNCYVKSRSSPSDPWTDITPWANPITASIPAERYSVDITADIGTKTQVMFEFSGYYYNLNYWYIDDFECGSYSTGFSGTFPPQGPSSYVPEYDQIATIPVIYPDETIELAFPVWSPADLYVGENVNIPYFVEATNLFADENSNNDYKSKTATLHYGWLNDVKVNAITSPVNSPAQSQIPEVIIENVGQLDQVADVNMVISKIQYGAAQWQVYNPNGGNTWVRSTTGQRTGTGCAKCTYEYTAEPNDDWLATYGVTVAPGGVFSFWVKGYTYNDDTYSVYMSTTGNTIADFLAGTLLFSGIAPSTYLFQTFDMSSYEGQTLYFAIFYNGNYAWYIWVDDVTLPDGTFEGFEGANFPPVEVILLPEYDETTTVSIAAGETLTVSLPEWFPADLPVLMNIDYLVTATVSMNTSDGNPSDNELVKMITLQYEHDVGVIEITEPSGEPLKSYLIWNNYADDGTGTGLSSQLDVVYPFNSQCADDFQFAATMDIQSVHWWGAFWNGATYPNPVEFNVIFYADSGSGTMPTGAGMDDPTPTALAVYNFPAVTGVSYGANKYEYDVPLDLVFVADAGVKYWIAIQEVAPFATDGQWGWSTNGANPEQLSGPVQGFPLLGTDYWTATTYGDHAFQLSGEEHQGGGYYWPPGTYPVEGIIKNFGVIFAESDIPVNTQVTHYGVIVYDETVTVAGPIAPGETAVVTFPNITIPNGYEWEGDYKLTMKTMLAGDAHPSNDKKILTFYIYIPPPPGETYADLSGKLGQNGWYISDVTITLLVYKQWPPGVAYTQYKIDDGEWTIYETPFQVNTDDYHTVYFFSAFTNGYVEPEKSVSFKIDKTQPTITMSVEKIGFRQWKFLAVAADETSGLALVQCYLDDMELGDILPPGPYEWLWTGKGNHTVTGIAYDLAGNSAENDVAFSYSAFYSHHFWLRSVIQRIIQLILSHLPRSSYF